MSGPITVFVSSTCYDLLDLRAELVDFLNQCGFAAVKASDDIYSDFVVNDDVNSIESCLSNVRASDAVVCIIDRRYGRPLPIGRYKGLSATHAEIEHAREHHIPVLVFVRDKAINDFDVLRNNSEETKTLWVSERDSDQKHRWIRFVDAQKALPPDGEHDRSNWFYSFQTSVDLKRMVAHRLLQKFPLAAASRALDPERLVRMTFIWSRRRDAETIYGHFCNAGIGSALNLQYGVTTASLQAAIGQSQYLGALAEKAETLTHDRKDLALRSHTHPTPVVFCEYENRFGDAYRVELPFRNVSGQLLPEGAEHLYARSVAGEWIRVV